MDDDPIKAAHRVMLIATGQLPNPHRSEERVTLTIPAKDELPPVPRLVKDDE